MLGWRIKMKTTYRLNKSTNNLQYKSGREYIDIDMEDVDNLQWIVEKLNGGNNE